MIEALKLVNLPSQTQVDQKDHPRAFILRTCQRTLILRHGPELVDSKALVGEEAYQFLLQTICGLKSQILAENEITAQFKEAYRSYLQHAEKSGQLIHILEKLFKDAKEVRTRYLLKVGQQSYAGITKKLLHSRWPRGREVLVVGSGALAQDVVKLLQKNYNITISARNAQKLREISENHKCQMRDWDELDKFWNHPTIVNTIGAEEILFNQHFFQRWLESHQKRQFIDLSSPSVIETPFGKAEGILRLENIFSHGVILNEEKQEKVRQAHQAINELVKKRAEAFTLNFLRAQKMKSSKGVQVG